MRASVGRAAGGGRGGCYGRAMRGPAAAQGQDLYFGDGASRQLGTVNKRHDQLPLGQDLFSSVVRACELRPRG